MDFNTFIQQNNLIADRLLSSLLSWKRVQGNIDLNQAYDLFEKNEEYGLRMLWQGRLDKLSNDQKEIYTWISSNYLPNNINFDINKIKEVQFINEDHIELVQIVLENVWNDYIKSQLPIEKPLVKNTSIFSKIKSFFN